MKNALSPVNGWQGVLGPVASIKEMGRSHLGEHQKSGSPIRQIFMHHSS